MILDSTFRNIVEEGFDAGVRLGESVEKDMVAVRIGPDWRLIAVASPGSLAAHGVPEHPQNLVRHVCINMRHETAGGLYAWEFEKGGQELCVRVEGQLTFNNSYAMIDAAVNGSVIAYVPGDIVERQIASGALVLVLDDWSPFFDGYFLYHEPPPESPDVQSNHRRSAASREIRTLSLSRSLCGSTRISASVRRLR
jgi:DNA-binding transcriptional LysR family regulator